MLDLEMDQIMKAILLGYDGFCPFQSYMVSNKIQFTDTFIQHTNIKNGFQGLIQSKSDQFTPS